MCGLVGIASTTILSFPEKKTFKQLLYIDAIRGWDSTGVASLDSKDEIIIAKLPVAAGTFMNTKLWDSLEKVTTTMMLGHNRAATKGVINANNAHPFKHGDITLAHNGTLWSHAELTSEYKKHFIVDSEAITYAMSKTDSPVDVIESLDGAYSLVWHDGDANTLNFARNDERPMWIATSANEGTILWASEEHMLHLAIRRSRLGVNFTIEEMKQEVWRSYTLSVTGKLVYEETPFKDGTTYGNHWTGMNTYGAATPYTPPKRSGNYKRESGRAAVTDLSLARQITEAARLQKLGVEKDEIVYILKDSFHPYSSTMTNGTGVTHFSNDAGVYFSISNSKEETYEKTKLYEGIVMGTTSAWFSHRNSDTVTLGDVALSSMEVDKEEEAVAWMYEDRQGNFVAESEYVELVKDGCAWCSDKVELDDTIVWTDSGALHKECNELFEATIQRSDK